MAEKRSWGIRRLLRSAGLAVALSVVMSSSVFAWTPSSRISMAYTGTQTDGNSHAPRLSQDGRYLLFQSQASTLVPNDTNGRMDVFLKDMQTGSVERVSLGAGGVQANGDSAAVGVSADGRYVAFTSWAFNLVTGDTNGTEDVFIRDRTTGEVIRASVSSTGTPGNGRSGYWASFSADGRYVAFWSEATNLVPSDTNATRDIFLFDRVSRTTERVSVSSAGVQANAESGYGVSVSGDGRYVAFASAASNLVDGDTNGLIDLFLRDRLYGTTQRLTAGNGPSSGPSISADGRFIAFNSTASNLVSGDTNGTMDIFVLDRQSSTVERVSVSSSGVQSNDGSQEPVISNDGRYVTFVSWASNLAGYDTNWTADVFIHDRVAHTTERVSSAADGSQGNGTSWGQWISGDGRVLAFKSEASNLITGDTNGFADIFVRSQDAPVPSLPAVMIYGFTKSVGSRAVSVNFTLNSCDCQVKEFRIYRKAGDGRFTPTADLLVGTRQPVPGANPFTETVPADGVYTYLIIAEDMTGRTSAVDGYATVYVHKDWSLTSHYLY